MQFFISSTKKGVAREGALVKEEVVDLDARNVFGAIHAYNESHPDRKAISSSVVLPGTPQDHLRRSYPCWSRNGYYVNEKD